MVPVVCGTEQGTAFFIEEGRLLTARHVVRGFFNSSSAPAQIVLKLPEREVFCKAEELVQNDVKFNVAVLTILDGEAYKAEDWLELLQDSFVKDLRLKTYGYPKEVAMGETLVALDIRNRLQIANWNDRSVVRDDNLQLRFYDGLSGAPVVNKDGQVVGLVIIQNNQTLNYLSVEKIQACLDDKGIGYSTEWEREDDTLLGQGRSFQFCEDAVKTVGDRYMPGVHQKDGALEFFLDTCTNAKRIEESVGHAEALASFVSQLPQEKKEKIREDLKFYEDISIESLVKDRYALLERCCDYFDTMRFRNQLSFSEDIKLHELRYALDKAGLEWAKGKAVRNVCLIGKAGSGKTHSLCYFALHKQKQANIYLFFGSEFKPHDPVLNHIREKVCHGESFADFNQGLVEKGRYAVIIIDAINEGLGCNFWNNNLGSLRTELEKYSNFRLVISVRSPFDKEINDLSGESIWHVRQIKGFVDLNQAIDDYFELYKVDSRFKTTRIEGFKNPLFLKLFCETYHSMTEEERRNVTKRTLYKRYVENKNITVSVLADEDPEINVTDRYLLKLANQSVFYNHCNPVTRVKARQLARRICPGRLWEKDLMHACLSSNLLLDDFSAEGEKAVMFEYENLGDYYKAERLLGSKMDTGRLMEWIVEERNYLVQHPEVANQKFEAAVKALFDCWWQQKEDVNGYNQIKSDGPLYDLYVESLIENDIQFNLYVDMLLRLDKEQVNPLQLIRDFDNVTLEETQIIHNKLLAYQNVGSRDVLWTRYVNQMYEMYGDGYVEEVPVEKNPEMEVTDDERKYLICTTWMLTSSHPRFRAILIRKIRKILNIHTDLILWLTELFEDVNDPYVQIGLYCAVCGVVLSSRDKKLTAEVAAHIYHRYYERKENVPQDLIVRQWTLKIIERAYYLDEACNYWNRIKTPFQPLPFDDSAVPDYYEVKNNRGYFGLQQGSMMMHASIYSFEDFNRYVIGTNNHGRSCDYFVPTEDEGKYIGIPLTDIMAELAYYIQKVFGWNDKLGYLDNGKYSRNRSHNDRERIGKKFQWLAWYRLNARMMDTYRVSREQYFYNGEEAEEKDLTKTPMPWNSSEVSRFDPTLEPAIDFDPKAGLSGMERMPIAGVEEKDWVENNAYLPEFKYKAVDEKGVEYVMLMGYDTTKSEDDKETFLFDNACFVKSGDAERFARWAKEQNFYGRWMPERRGMTEYLWNEYPWSDAYKINNADYEDWDNPQDCPVKIMLSYEAQLQEDWEGIEDDKEYLTTVYMPCREIMEQFGLYCSDVRGVIKNTDGSAIALNTGSGNCINGLFIRKDVLDAYLNRNGYVMFYYVLGEKVHRLGGTAAVMKDLSAAFQYKPDGEIFTIQPMRVIERELPKRYKYDQARIEELKKKNETEGLTTLEMHELVERENDINDAEFLDVMKEIDDEEDVE